MERIVCEIHYLKNILCSPFRSTVIADISPAERARFSWSDVILNCMAQNYNLPRFNELGRSLRFSLLQYSRICRYLYFTLHLHSPQLTEQWKWKQTKGKMHHKIKLIQFSLIRSDSSMRLFYCTATLRTPWSNLNDWNNLFIFNWWNNNVRKDYVDGCSLMRSTQYSNTKLELKWK